MYANNAPPHVYAGTLYGVCIATVITAQENKPETESRLVRDTRGVGSCQQVRGIVAEICSPDESKMRGNTTSLQGGAECTDSSLRSKDVTLSTE